MKIYKYKHHVHYTLFTRNNQNHAIVFLSCYLAHTYLSNIITVCNKNKHLNKSIAICPFISCSKTKCILFFSKLLAFSKKLFINASYYGKHKKVCIMLPTVGN